MVENNTINNAQVNKNRITEKEIMDFCREARSLKEIIALSAVVAMSGIALILTGIAIKRTEIYKKYKE